MADGEVCVAESICKLPEPEAFVCSLPASSPQEAATILEAVGSGGALGTGMKTTRLGAVIPIVRHEYERRIAHLVAEVERRRAAGEPSATIARWVVGERRRIANEMRWRTGAGTRVLFEVRDWTKYGPGGRTYRNMEARYSRRGLQGVELHDSMVRGATSPNTGISRTALQGARYLKNAGRVVIVLSLASTAYVLLTAPEAELERLMYEEAGGWTGGSIGAGFGVGACLVFGIATGGWGLLACGIVGGFGGGVLGASIGERVYYSRNPKVEQQPLASGVLDSRELTTTVPPQMCFAY